MPSQPQLQRVAPPPSQLQPSGGKSGHGYSQQHRRRNCDNQEQKKSGRGCSQQHAPRRIATTRRRRAGTVAGSSATAAAATTATSAAAFTGEAGEWARASTPGPATGRQEQLRHRPSARQEQVQRRPPCQVQPPGQVQRHHVAVARVGSSAAPSGAAAAVGRGRDGGARRQVQCCQREPSAGGAGR